MTDLEKEQYTIAGITYSFVYRALAIVFIELSLLYFAIWQGIEFTEYEWIYSTNTMVKAGQYMAQGLWGIVFSTSPAWWLGSVILSVKTILKKNII